MAHAFNASTPKTGESLWLQCQLYWQNEFQDNQGYMEKSCPEKQKEQQQQQQ